MINSTPKTEVAFARFFTPRVFTSKHIFMPISSASSTAVYAAQLRSTSGWCMAIDCITDSKEVISHSSLSTSIISYLSFWVREKSYASIHFHHVTRILSLLLKVCAEVRGRGFHSFHSCWWNKLFSDVSSFSIKIWFWEIIRYTVCTFGIFPRPAPPISRLPGEGCILLLLW